MTTTREERIKFLSDIIQLATADNIFASEEADLIVRLAHHMNLSKDDVALAEQNKHGFTYPKKESERFVQFYQLILVMNVDQKSTKEEILQLHQFGLKMGLNPIAVSRVIDLSKSAENGKIEPDELMQIFQQSFN